MSRRVVVWLTPDSMHDAACKMRDDEADTGRLGQSIDPTLQLIIDCPPSRHRWQWASRPAMLHYWHGPIVLINCRCQLPDRAALLPFDPDNVSASIGPDYEIVKLYRSRYRFYGSRMTLWFGQCGRCGTCYYHSDSVPLDGMLPAVPDGEFSVAADLLEENGFAAIADAVRKLETTPEEAPTP